MKTPRLSILRSRRWRIALGILAIALPAMADAPKNPPQYDQFDRDEIVITDRFTHLVWDRRRVQKVDHTTGGATCQSLFAPLVGRIPTVKELLTLVDEDPHQEYDSAHTPPVVLKSIDQLAFPNTPTDDAYWTSTAAPGGKFWTVEFTSGRTEPRAAGETLNVRCVR